MVMKEKLIADAGSTKIDWAVIEEDGSVRCHTSDGLNAMLSDTADMASTFTNIASALDAGNDISEIHYYGAGCATPAICMKTEQALREAFGSESVSVTSDLLGAARSLLGNSRGIACILGTGSNSCLYDGRTIVSNVPSLGFILGDEGSGATLGKRLVSDAFKGHLPKSVKEKFLAAYSLTLPEILDRIYRQPNPNKFLAALVPFLSDNLWNPYIYSLVLKELTTFLTRNVMMYPDVHSIEISFTGSVAFNFAKLLKEAASSQGLAIGKITKTPLDGLIAYHSTKHDYEV